MGPKPFTSMGANEVSFDKVFSVPQVPGNTESSVVEAEPVYRSNESSDNSIDEQKDSDEKDGKFIVF